jgi:hypothetical protein
LLVIHAMPLLQEHQSCRKPVRANLHRRMACGSLQGSRDLTQGADHFPTRTTPGARSFGLQHSVSWNYKCLHDLVISVKLSFSFLFTPCTLLSSHKFRWPVSLSLKPHHTPTLDLTALFPCQTDPCMHYNNACQRLYGQGQPIVVQQIGNVWYAVAGVNLGMCSNIPFILVF